MKLKLKLITLTIITLAITLVTYGQNAQKAVLSTADTTCSAATNCLHVVVDQVVVNAGSATFTVSANASSNTIQFEASGSNGDKVSALNVYPSNSVTAATSTTSTGTWQANVAGYTDLYIRMSTLAGGTTSVAVKLSSAAGPR